MRIAEAVAAYLDYLQASARRAPATVAAYRMDLNRFAAFAESTGRATLAQVDEPLVEGWKGNMRDLADATVRRALNSLSGLFRWAMLFRHAERNPLDRIERPRKKRHLEPCPTPAEVSALLQATRNETERAALLALATSGLRRAELLSLRWESVDLQARRLRVRGKGDKDREVIVFEDLLGALYALHARQGMPDTGPVFRGRRGEALQTSTLQRWLNTWSQTANLRDEAGNRYTLHSLRRFAAKQWLNSGLNIRQVQVLLGHESLQTTILYLNYSFEEIARDAGAVSFGLETGGEANAGRR